MWHRDLVQGCTEAILSLCLAVKMSRYFYQVISYVVYIYMEQPQGLDTIKVSYLFRCHKLILKDWSQVLLSNIRAEVKNRPDGDHQKRKKFTISIQKKVLKTSP